MIAFLVMFILYQGYQITTAFSWGMVLLTVFDLFIVVLIWHEYRAHSARAGGHRLGGLPPNRHG